MNDLTPQGAAAVRLAAQVVQLRQERDRARDIAVALEGQLARVEALADAWDDPDPERGDPDRADALREALEVDQ